MSYRRTATVLRPWMVGGTLNGALGATRTPYAQRPLAIIIAQLRTVSTEPAAHTAGSTYPPPGFDPSKAKKALPQDQKASAGQNEKSSSSKPVTLDSEVADSVAISKSKPTSHAKTAAQEAVSLAEQVPANPGAGKGEDKKLSSGQGEPQKLTLMEKIKRELVHYWDGTKLLAVEIKISSKLALKMAAGYELTRREERQLQRTVQDLARLVPFSVFLIVPFAELLLPVALKLFPNMLPSTYEGQKSRETKASHLRATRKEVSSFLRLTLKETGLPVSAASAHRDEFVSFFRKVRSTGESPTSDDVIKVCKAFKDDLTLDNLSRPQLVAICRYMNLTTFGIDSLLRYHIRRRMRQIKRDDKAIAFEGVDSLSVIELQNAAASRGLRTYGLSPARLREDLQMWLDLRLKYGVPSTLLVLSNAFVYAQGKESEIGSQIDALQAVLSSIPEELFHEIELVVHNAEGAATNKQRLEVLKEQQELIEEEEEQSRSQTGDRTASSSVPTDKENIDEAEESEEAEETKEQNEDLKEERKIDDEKTKEQ